MSQYLECKMCKKKYLSNPVTNEILEVTKEPPCRGGCKILKPIKWLEKHIDTEAPK